MAAKTQKKKPPPTTDELRQKAVVKAGHFLKARGRPRFDALSILQQEQQRRAEARAKREQRDGGA